MAPSYTDLAERVLATYSLGDPDDSRPVLDVHHLLDEVLADLSPNATVADVTPGAPDHRADIHRPDGAVMLATVSAREDGQKAARNWSSVDHADTITSLPVQDVSTLAVVLETLHGWLRAGS